MKAFRDCTGKEWSIVINLTSLARVMDLAHVDLTKILQPDGVVETQLENPNTHLSMIAALLKPQLEAAGLEPQAFGERLDEEVINAIDEAIYEETIAFFREPKRTMLQTAFRKLRAAQKTVEAEAAARAGTLLQSLDFDAVVKTVLDGKGSAGSWPASLESTPAPARSAS